MFLALRLSLLRQAPMASGAFSPPSALRITRTSLTAVLSFLLYDSCAARSGKAAGWYGG